MRQTLGLCFFLLFPASLFADATASLAAASQAGFLNPDDKSLRSIAAYMMTLQAAGAISANAALQAAAGYLSMDDHSLLAVTAYYEAQITAGNFSTNWVASIHTNSPTISRGSPTNFTDQQFQAGFNGGLFINGALADNSAVLSGTGNAATGVWSVVCGGQGNLAGGVWSFVGGGFHSASGSRALGNASCVVGGEDNTACGNLSFIGSGNDNVIGNAAVIDTTHNTWSAIVSGNNLELHGQGSFMGTGDANHISLTDGAVGGANFCAIVTGQNNSIEDTSSGCFIGSGKQNVINTLVTNCFIGSGNNNNITANLGSILGGQGNSVSGSNSMALGSSLTVAANNTVAVGIGDATKAVFSPTNYSFQAGIFWKVSNAPVGFNPDPSLGAMENFITNITAGAMVFQPMTNIVNGQWFDFICVATNSHGSGGPFPIIFPSNVKTNIAGTVLQLTNQTYCRFSGVGFQYTNGFGSPQQ